MAKLKRRSTIYGMLCALGRGKKDGIAMLVDDRDGNTYRIKDHAIVSADECLITVYGNSKKLSLNNDVADVYCA